MRQAQLVAVYAGNVLTSAARNCLPPDAAEAMPLGAAPPADPLWRALPERLDPRIVALAHALCPAGPGPRCAGAILGHLTPPQAVTQLRGWAALSERLRRLCEDQVVGFGLGQQVEILGGLAAMWRSMPSVPLSLPAPARGAPGWRWLPPAAALMALAALAAGALHMARLRRGPALTPLGRALTAALERLHGGPLPPSWTLRRAAERLQVAAGSAAEHPDVAAALATYEAQTYGPAAPPSEPPRALARALASVGRGRR